MGWFCLIVTFWIFAILFAVMALVGGVLAGVVGRKPENAKFQKALIAAAIFPAIALVLFIIGFFILRTAAKAKGA